MLHGLELSINSPGFSRASQWSRTFPAGVIPPPSEVFKTSRPGKEHGFRRAESRNRSLGRGGPAPCQLSQRFPRSRGSCWGFLAAEVDLQHQGDDAPLHCERAKWCQKERRGERGEIPAPHLHNPGPDAGASIPRALQGAAEARDAPHPSLGKQTERVSDLMGQGLGAI